MRWRFTRRLTEQSHEQDQRHPHAPITRCFTRSSTRWSDNDIYGHVNNVTYYSYFDTAANRYLIEEGGLDISDGTIVGYVVNSGCEYHAPITYPEAVEAGVRVDRLGNSSVQYGIAIFREGEQVPQRMGISCTCSWNVPPTAPCPSHRTYELRWSGCKFSQRFIIQVAVSPNLSLTLSA